MARTREFDKAEVIERAMLLFWAQGYEATSIRDLMQVMGISSSSMYEVFGDKRGIFLAALARFCELERTRIARMAEEAATPRLFIERLFSSIEIAAQSNSPAQGSLAFNTMTEFGTLDADVTDLLLSHYFGIADIIASVLAQGQLQVTISSQQPPLHLAHTILSALHGAATVKAVKPDFAFIQAITHTILKLLD